MQFASQEQDPSLVLLTRSLLASRRKVLRYSGSVAVGEGEQRSEEAVVVAAAWSLKTCDLEEVLGFFPLRFQHTLSHSGASPWRG